MESKGRDKGRDGILGLVPKVKRRRISFAAFIILEGSNLGDISHSMVIFGKS